MKRLEASIAGYSRVTLANPLVVAFSFPKKLSALC
jgi:hypothetical protein